MNSWMKALHRSVRRGKFRRARDRGTRLQRCTLQPTNVRAAVRSHAADATDSGLVPTLPHLIWSLKTTPPPINSANPPTTPSDAASLALGPLMLGGSSVLHVQRVSGGYQHRWR